jgi:hypothetical protein
VDRRVANLATKVGSEAGKFNFYALLTDLMKVDIIQFGALVNTDFGLTAASDSTDQSGPAVAYANLAARGLKASPGPA